MSATKFNQTNQVNLEQRSKRVYTLGDYPIVCQGARKENTEGGWVDARKKNTKGGWVDARKKNTKGGWVDAHKKNTMGGWVDARNKG